jgi:hypothetical protein
LEEWCSQFGAWDHSDNVVDYGYEVVTEVPPQYLHAQLLDLQEQIDTLQMIAGVVRSALNQPSLVAEVSAYWDAKESHLDGLFQSVRDGFDEYEDEDEEGNVVVEQIPNTFADWDVAHKEQHIQRLMHTHAEKRRLAEKYATQGIRVAFNFDDEPKIRAVTLQFTDAEWVGLLDKGGEYLPVCCADVSRIRDILGSAIRESGEIGVSDLWEAVQLIKGHEDCSAFPIGHPLLKLVELWGRIEEDADTQMTCLTLNPDDPREALELLYECSSVVAWEHLFDTPTKSEKFRKKVTVNFTLAKLWPAIKTVYHKLAEIGFGPIHGWAVCCGQEILDSRSGFCIFENHEKAVEVAKRANAAAHTDWEQEKVRRLKDIENGEYEEGGRYEDQSIPPVPQKKDYTVRSVCVSVEKGIEFLPDSLQS